MMDQLKDVAEIILSVLTINGILYGVFYKFIKKPLTTKYNTFCNKIENIDTTTKKLNNYMNEQLIPFMSSFQDEFSTNSGKSIKDRITRIDNTLKKEETRNKMLSDSLSMIGTYECDAMGRCTWANVYLCEMFGLSFSEMLGNGWLSAVCSEYRTEVWLKWMENVKYDIPYEATYYVCNTKTHEKYLCRANTVAFRNVSGVVDGYYGTIVRVADDAVE